MNDLFEILKQNSTYGTPSDYIDLREHNSPLNSLRQLVAKTPWWRVYDDTTITEARVLHSSRTFSPESKQYDERTSELKLMYDRTTNRETHNVLYLYGILN